MFNSSAQLMEFSLIIALLSAFILDLVFGDPRKLPHLIVYYGKTIAWGEKVLNHKGNQFIKGTLLSILLVSSSFLIPFGIISYFQVVDYTLISILFSTIMLFYCLANRTLIKEGYAVFNALKKEGLEAGRKRLSWIVGRETSNLTAQQIRSATFETMSENLSDGVIAPLFYFALFGVPGAMAYKMINTLDSMIGYKNERYEQFGKFAAKLDDVANYIPARLTAILMLLVNGTPQGIGFLVEEGKKHSSPNAGYPEAALAYILDCQFGGPNYYHGKLVDKPYIGHYARILKHEEIHRVAKLNVYTSFVTVSLIVLLLL